MSAKEAVAGAIRKALLQPTVRRHVDFDLAVRSLGAFLQQLLYSFVTIREPMEEKRPLRRQPLPSSFLLLIIPDVWTRVHQTGSIPLHFALRPSSSAISLARVSVRKTIARNMKSFVPVFRGFICFGFRWLLQQRLSGLSTMFPSRKTVENCT